MQTANNQLHKVKDLISLVMRFFRWSAFKVGPMPPAFKAVEKVMGSLLIGNLSLLPLPTVFLRELGQLIKGH